MKYITSQPKKVWIIAAVVTVVLLAIAGYVFASVMQWQAMDQKAQSQLALTKKTAKTALATSSDRTTHLEAAQALAAMKTTTESLCQPRWWYGWQTSLTGDIKHSFDACKATKKKLTAAVVAATEVDDYLNDETKLIDILKGLAIEQKQLTEKNWQVAAIDTSARAHTELVAFKPSLVLTPTAKEATTRVITITTKWKAFLAADKKENKAAYLSALDAIDQAYADLANISDVSDAQINKYMLQLKTATAAL